MFFLSFFFFFVDGDPLESDLEAAMLRWMPLLFFFFFFVRVKYSLFIMDIDTLP